MAIHEVLAKKAFEFNLKKNNSFPNTFNYGLEE